MISITNKNNILKICIFILSISFIIFTAPHSALFEKFDFTYNEFLQEDGIIEYLTSFLYLTSFVLSILIAKIFFKNQNKIFGVSYVILGIIFLIGGFEEISWGQRILEINTPELISSNNIQNEINFHNLNTFPNNLMNGFLLISGFYGSFFWIFVSYRKYFSDNSFVRYFVPKWYLTVFFIPPFLSGLEYILKIFDLWDLLIFIASEILLYHQIEFFEFSLSAAVFLFIVSIFLKLKFRDIESK